jgi:hypothetical protein
MLQRGTHLDLVPPGMQLRVLQHVCVALVVEPQVVGEILLVLLPEVGAVVRVRVVQPRLARGVHHAPV